VPASGAFGLTHNGGMAGTDKPILQKLLYKPGARAAVLNAPDSYQQQIPDALRQIDEGQFDFIHVFVTRRDEVARDGPGWRAALKAGGIFWASYPKGKALPTDLNRDSLRLALQGIGLDPVMQVSIDDVWSALRAKPI
jgi:hypothetical protein